MIDQRTPAKERNWKLAMRRRQIIDLLEERPSVNFEEVVEASRIPVSESRSEICRRQSGRILGELLESGYLAGRFERGDEQSITG